MVKNGEKRKATKKRYPHHLTAKIAQKSLMHGVIHIIHIEKCEK